MSHEDRALAELDSAVTNGLQAVSVAVRDVIATQKGFAGQVELSAVMKSTIGVILACTALEKAASDAMDACRDALASAMALGFTTVRTDHHTASLVTASQRARVTDERLLPAALMRQPAPSPDLTAIRALLMAGQTVPGAELSNGGPDTLSIRTRKIK